MTASPELLVGMGHGIATLTLHRPDRRNALSLSLRSTLRSTLVDLDADPDIRAIVLTGADPAFCGGLDLQELARRDRSAPQEGGGTSPIPEISTPLIAAVNGAAVTGGLELVLRCDVVVASTRASFRDTHAQVGLVSAWGMASLLPAAVGSGRAREMILSGRRVDADEALRIGLVQHVVDHDDLLAAAMEIAGAIAANDPDAVRRAVELGRELTGMSRTDAMAHELGAGNAWAKALLDRVAPAGSTDGA